MPPVKDPWNTAGAAALRHALALIVALVLLAACSQENPAPAATSEPIQTAAPAAALATATATPEPTATPTTIPTPLPLASIAGRVLDEATGQPVAGASVSAGELRATTDEGGQFLIEGLAPGQYVVVAEHPDYDPFVSGILGLKSGEARHVDALLSTSGAAAVPRDPMASNQVDPAGAPTAEEAERLARLQGFEGAVASIQQTVLDGEYLVNYKAGDSLRAAQAALQHPAWELIDQDGAAWYIVQVCGNLAVARPAQVQVPASHVTQPYPVVTVGEAEVPGYACPDETCEVVTTLPAGWYGTVLGCAQDCQWLWVQGSGFPGGCWIQAGGHAIYGDPAQVASIPGEINWTEPERLGPGGGYTQQLLLDPAGRLWAFWEEHVFQPNRIYAAVHYRVWNGQNWEELQDVPGSDQMGEPVATLLNDGSILLRADLPLELTSNEYETRWFHWQDDQWTPVPAMTATASSIMGGNIAADGSGAVHALAANAQAWDGSAWRATGAGPTTMFKATAQDSKGNLHAVASSQDGIQHWMWDGDHWAMKETIFMPSGGDSASWPALAIGPNDTLHAVWDNNERWQTDPNTAVPYWISYSRWNGAQWTEPQTLFGPVDDTFNWNPDIAVLPDGLVVVVWGDVGQFPDSNVFVTWGDGSNWVEPVLLPRATKDDQMEARVEADAQGRIHIIWDTAGGLGVFHVMGMRQ